MTSSSAASPKSAPNGEKALFPDDDKKPSKLRKVLTVGFLVLLVLGLLGGTGFVLFMKMKYADFQPPSSPAAVVLSTVTSHEFTDEIEAVGTTSANQSVTLTATVTETVKSVNAQEGQFISKGTSIVDLTDAQEQATLNEAQNSYNRYSRLVKDKLASAEKQDQTRASLDVAKAQIDKRKIVAPFDGFLGLRRVDVGGIVQPGTVITTLDEIDPLKVDFTVPEVELAALKSDMDIEAESAAFPGTVFKGKVYVIDSRVNPDSHAVAARATIENHDHKLKPGMLMTVRLIKAKTTSLAVPEESVMFAGKRKTVFVVDKDNKVSEVEIKTGQREPGYVEVLGGLTAGQKVIVEGQMKARPGSTVTVAGEKTVEEMRNEELGYSNERKQDSLGAGKGQ